MRIALLSYGAGNIKSLHSFLASISNADVKVFDNLEEIGDAQCLILPGVGSFGYASQKLCQTNSNREIISKFHDAGNLVIGICLGAQILLSKSDEAPGMVGFDIISGFSRYLARNESYKGSIPRIGWARQAWNFLGNKSETYRYCYFVHSYELQPTNADEIFYSSDGIVSGYRKYNYWGLQFHPEKSHDCGRMIFNDILTRHAQKN